MNQEEIEKAVNSVKASFAMEDMIITKEEEKDMRDILSGERDVEDVVKGIMEECKMIRSLKIANGKALCELDNRKGASNFLAVQNEKYIEGMIDSNTLIENVIDHYKQQ